MNNELEEFKKQLKQQQEVLTFLQGFNRGQQLRIEELEKEVALLKSRVSEGLLKKLFPDVVVTT